MMAVQRRLCVELVVQTPSPNDPAVAIAAETFLPQSMMPLTAELATSCDVTFENEFVNLEALLPLAQGVCFRPGLQVLSPLLDKYHQRCYLKQLGLPVPKFVALEGGAEELRELREISICNHLTQFGSGGAESSSTAMTVKALSCSMILMLEAQIRQENLGRQPCFY